MSLRLWRRKQLFSGMRVNLSKSGLSLSVGRKGAWYTSGPRGQRVTAGWPGTGLFWTEKLPPLAAVHRRHGTGELIVGLIVIVAVAVLLFGGQWIAAHP
jgi:hypothetical protein